MYVKLKRYDTHNDLVRQIKKYIGSVLKMCH